MMTVSPAGSGAFFSQDAAGVFIAELEQPPEGHMALRVRNSAGQTLAGVGINEHGNGALKVSDSTGKIVAAVQGREDGTGAVDVFGEDGSGVAGLEVDRGGGLIAVRDDGKSIAALGQSSHGNGGNITLNDSSGSGVFSAGSGSDEGEACVNLKNGMWCMGKNLPLQH
jgi:hypothetical protein